MAEFGNGNYSTAYFEETFGKMGIAEGSIYKGGVDSYEYKAKHDEVTKHINKSFGSALMTKVRETDTSEYASGTNYSATSGKLPVLIPIWVSPDIINLSQKESPVYEMLPKVAIRGKFYDWNKMTYASTYARFLPEDAALPETDDTYERSITQMKYCYAVGRVSGPMQVASRGYIDMERQEILTKTGELLHKLEYTILNGNAGSDANEFSGLSTLISTNDTNKSGAAIAISDLRTSILYCKQGGSSWGEVQGGGNPNMIICDLATFDDIKALLQAYLRYNGPMTSIAWGFQTIEFEGIPIVSSKHMTTTSSSKALYIIDTNVVKMGISLDITMERLAKTNDSNKFMLKWYGALLVLAENFCAKIRGIL